MTEASQTPPQSTRPLAARRARLSIVGLTATGNKGAESMLLAIIEQMSRRLGGCEFDLISVYPARDRQHPLPENVRIVAGKPLRMLALLPLCVLLAPFARLAPLRALLRLSGVLRSWLDSDAVLDASGVAFVDRRGLPLLAYNMALCLSPALLGCPVVKLAQALGPFRTRTNRLAAAVTLRRMGAVMARGEITGAHLAELGGVGFDVCADTAFVMPVSPQARVTAEKIVAGLSGAGRRVGIAPSVVVEDYCRAHQIDYPAILAEFVRHAVGRGFRPVLIPHSIRPRGAGRRNNDLLVCDATLARLPAGLHVPVVDEELSADALRALIGRMDFFLASRFHSMVSALACGVPTLLIGWSHKYREVMRMFEVEDWAMDYAELSSEVLRKRFDELVASEQGIRAKLRSSLPTVTRLSERNFELAASVVRRRATS